MDFIRKKHIRTLKEVQTNKIDWVEPPLNMEDHIEQLRLQRIQQRIQHFHTSMDYEREILEDFSTRFDNLQRDHERKLRKIDRIFKFIKWGMVAFVIAQIVVTIIKIK